MVSSLDLFMLHKIKKTINVTANLISRVADDRTLAPEQTVKRDYVRTSFLSGATDDRKFVRMGSHEEQRELDRKIARPEISPRDASY